MHKNLTHLGLGLKYTCEICGKAFKDKSDLKRHIIALHDVGSNNPDGVSIKKYKDKNEQKNVSAQPAPKLNVNKNAKVKHQNEAPQINDLKRKFLII